MEGYTDVILAHKAGMRRAVATLGTALGRDHAHELRRHSPRVLLLYDGDEAGLRASERGVGILLEEGLEVRVAALPDEMDPADYVLAHGGPKFLAAVGAGVEFLEFLGARIRARGVGLGGPEDRARVRRGPLLCGEDRFAHPAGIVGSQDRVVVLGVGVARVGAPRRHPRRGGARGRLARPLRAGCFTGRRFRARRNPTIQFPRFRSPTIRARPAGRRGAAGGPAP